jgi:hypothetical protein
LKVFIWTEAFNCGEILNPMLSSYIKHNNYPIHIYGTQLDFEQVEIKSELFIWDFLNKKTFFRKPLQSKILKGYQSGHKGTAYLWEYVINSREEEILIHLDSDTIFLEEVIEDLIQAIKVDGYSIAGSRRPYRNRDYRKDGKDKVALDNRPDVVNTDCFAFTSDKITKRPKFWLRRKILGRRVSLKPVVDAFDPITFEIIKKKGTVKYMDTPDNGEHSWPDGASKFLQARISFSAVGSGCNFIKNGHVGIPEHYANYAIASYALFAREFLQKDIGVIPLENEGLTNKLNKLDKINWKLIKD